MFTIDSLKDYVQSLGLDNLTGQLVYSLIVLIALLFLAFLSDFVSKKLLLSGLGSFIHKTKVQWDDALIRRKVLNRLSRIVPAIVIYLLAPLPFPEYPLLGELLKRLALGYMILTCLFIVDAILNVVYDVYHGLTISRNRPIKTYIQIIKIIIYISSVILIIGVILNKSPWAFLSGIGAMTAIILLVFKDTILGFVASVQLYSQNMLRIGDWIEMPKYGADGDIIDIILNTVKVQNWDKTITTIPTYKFIDDSFKNWRGMSESSGRRIKRALYIDMHSIKFCDEVLLKHFEEIELLQDYLTHKKQEIKIYNESQKSIAKIRANMRQLTNLGTFRAYVVAYLKHHPKINQQMTLMVRQLDPSANGLPLEVYCFSSDKVWENYESIQSDIFDHLLSILPEFGLEVFQNPTGLDFREKWGAKNEA